VRATEQDLVAVLLAGSLSLRGQVSRRSVRHAVSLAWWTMRGGVPSRSRMMDDRAARTSALEMGA
jgi:hypothetical protein